MRIVQKAGLFIITWAILSLFFYGLYHLEVLLKPMTDFVKFITFWSQQGFALIVAAIIVIVHEPKSK